MPNNVVIQISFEADIRANTLEYLPAQDFTSIFCNLLDNAIDASLSCDEPYIDCNVSLIRGGNADLISIANSCKSSLGRRKTHSESRTLVFTDMVYKV
ncbi:MAG: GHKL domain-containing protein [Lachnospira eligens]